MKRKRKRASQELKNAIVRAECDAKLTAAQRMVWLAEERMEYLCAWLAVLSLVWRAHSW